MYVGYALPGYAFNMKLKQLSYIVNNWQVKQKKVTDKREAVVDSWNWKDW